MNSNNKVSPNNSCSSQETQSHGEKSEILDFSRTLIDLHSLFDAIDCPVSLLDTEFRYQYVNKAYEEYLGIPRENLIGKKPSIIIGEKQFEQDIQPNLLKCLDGEQISFPLWVDYPNVGRRYMDVLYAPRIATDGKIEGILHISRDITEKHFLEERSASIIDIAFNCFFVVDMNGRIIETNERGAEMLGYSREELLSMHIWDLDVLEEKEDTLRRIQDIRNMRQIRFESKERCKDGTIIDVEVSATYSDHDGGRLYSFVRDLSPFQEKERQIRESEARFKALHNASFGGIAIHDKGIILDCNLGLSETSGYTVEELVGMDGLLLIAERSRGEVMQNILSGYEKPYEVYGVRKNGEEYPLRLEARNIPYQGRTVRAVEFRDITEVRRVMEEQASLKARLTALWHISRMVEAGYRELCDLVIEETQALTGSQYSFFGFLDDKESAMSIHTWSRDAMRECAVGENPIHFPIDKAGVWAKAVIQRQPVIIDDYERTAERKRGLPHGHVPIRNLLSVPIVRAGRVVALAAVANKNGDYTKDDINQVSAFVNSAILLLEQRRIKNELMLSQERLSLAVEMANMGHWELDLSSMEFTFNEQLYSLYGTMAEREGGFLMTAETYAREFAHPDESGIVASEMARIMAGEYDHSTAQIEHRIVRRDGEVRNIIVRFMVIRDKNGQRTKVIGVNQDITERKQAEAALRESEEKFRSAFDSSPDAININRLSDGLYIDINKGFTDLTGFTREDVQGKTSKEIDIWCNYGDRAQLIWELEENGFCANLESTFRKKDMSVVTALMSARTIVLNNEKHIISITRDITDRKNAEKLLDEARNDFESIFENSQIGIMMLKNGRFMARANQRLADIFGYASPEDMTGMSMRDLHLDEDHYADFGERYYKGLSRGEQKQVDFQLKRKNGDVIWCTLSGKALDPRDLSKGVIWVVDDITARKAMEDQIVRARMDAEAANKSKSEFLANMSHEIRTPLNGISGMMQLLQTTDLDREQKEYVDMATRSTGRLTRLLTDILDISRIEAGKLELLRQEFRVRDLTRSVSELFDVTHSEKEVPLLCRIDPDIPDILVGDEARIRQILFNLVGNAFKFTERGSITLEVYPISSPRPDELRIIFSVHDTGIGIPEDKLKNLFAPFAQVETAYSRNYQGAGLGLAIVRRLASLMGGHVVMDTVPGEGTSAHVVLPFEIREAEKATQHAEHDRSALPLKGLRILLVEDDISNRFFMEKLLEKAGASSATAGNGHEALELWKEGHFDCILMDIQMPVMDGVEATRAIRGSAEAGGKNSIPIIALTSYAMADDREKFLAAGMDAYLGKPVKLQDLEEAISTACGRRIRPRA